MVTTLGATFFATAGTASSPAPVDAGPDGTTPAVGTAAVVGSGASEGGEVEPVHAEDMSPSASTRTTPRAGILTLDLPGIQVTIGMLLLASPRQHSRSYF
jgi:hypothetical protein